MLEQILGYSAAACIIGAMAGIIEWRRLRSLRKTLMKQNLIYLVSFVNYFDWIEHNYMPSVIASVLGNEDYREFMKKHGIPEKTFSVIMENALVQSNTELRLKTNAVMEDIKAPLSPEINALLEGQ